MGSKLTKKYAVRDFINSPKVQANLQKLHDTFGAGKKSFEVSDTLDKDGNQYVNLVQKGGGVLGVALVGYTYILEQMGIRFLRMAGTSAGAINTAMLTVIGQKHEEKSTRVLEAITNLNFFDLVDGHPVAKWLIKRFITHKNYVHRIKAIAIGLVGFFLLLLLGAFLSLLLIQRNPSLLQLSNALILVLVIVVVLLAELVRYILALLKKFKTSGYGINPGHFFYNWMKTQMEANGVKTIDDLKNKAGQAVEGLHLRHTNTEGMAGLDGEVTFIASELVTQNKIEFPKMSALFCTPEGLKDLHPAGFVRASMSIPLFFESWFIKDIPCQDPSIREKWRDTFGEDDPPTVARFVDGGILSNFPISIFYNPKVLIPRLPTFGIDLNDANPEDNKKNAVDWSMGGYFGRIFNAIRNYYDKDFQIKNKVYSQGIGTIPLSDFNWLNFFLTDNEKLAMFERGAEAATAFLLNFNWQTYKNERASMQSTLDGNVG